MFYKNGLSKISVYIINTIVVMLTIPVIITNLGMETFGTITIINASIAYLSIATSAIQANLGKNLIFNINKGEEINCEINTTVILFFMLFIIVAAVYVLLLNYNGSKFINLNKNNYILYLVMLISFFVGMVTSVFQSVSFAYNRLYVQSIIDFINKTIANLLLIIVFIYISNNIDMYGYTILSCSVITLSIAYKFAKRLHPNLNFSYKYFSKNIIKNNLSSSFWIIINQISALLFIQSVIVVVGTQMGSFYAGLLGISFVVINQLRNITAIISSLFEVKLVELISEKNYKSCFKYLIEIYFFIGLLCSFITGIFIGSSHYFMGFWLNNPSELVISLTVLSVIYIPFTVGMTPAWLILLSLKKIKLVSIISLLLGLINIILAILFIKYTTYGLYAVIITSSILLIVKNNIFIPYIFKRYGFNITEFFKVIMFLIGYYLFVVASSSYIFQKSKIDGGWDFIFWLIISSLIAISPIIVVKNRLLNLVHKFK